MNLKHSTVSDRNAFLELVDPSLSLLDHPTRLTGEVDRVAALGLLVSITALVPLASGAAAAIVMIAKKRS